ncbi:MAG TPA: TlpA disulfide reductase family protein [Candidatus Sulfotelmatobacter sp.]|nr:TlpA disulfide reductase family protein [Candidatus Sulfotelmatobacter sp.]
MLDRDAPAPVPAAEPAAPAQAAALVGARRRHSARWVAATVAVLAAGLVVVLATRPPATATEVNSPLVGRPAPALTGTTLGGKPFSLASLSGRFVFVNFFASWCPPCQQEQADLVSFAYHHRAPDDAAIVGVVFDDAASSAHAFLTQSGAGWPALADPAGTIALAYGVRGPPETFLVSPSGMVVAHFDGPVTAAFLDHWLGRAEQQGS